MKLQYPSTPFLRLPVSRENYPHLAAKRKKRDFRTLKDCVGGLVLAAGFGALLFFAFGL